ncbi:MAG: hypothetical protein WEB62_04135 [Bacteroidota bacterium]
MEPELSPFGMNNYLDVSNRSLLMLEGNEGKDLLQRLSTNDLSGLEIDGYSQTILTNEKGRIVEVLSILMLSSDRILLIGQSNEGDRLRAWLDKFIIMEDVRAILLNNAYKHFIFYRSDISQKNAQKRGGSTAGEDWYSLKKSLDLPTDTLAFDEQWGEVRIFHLLVNRTQEKSLKLPGRYSGSAQIQYERYRLVHGIPVSPNELSDSYNPLEANLGGLVSWTKGCYIGQEVIARLDTYKKVQKHLVRVQLGEQPASLPVKLMDKEREAGVITSAVTLEDGRSVGLAYIGANSLSGSEFFFERAGRSVKVERSRE